MNIRCALLALGLTVGLAQGATQIGAIGTDLDDVLTMSDSFLTYFSQARQALGFKTFAKGLAHVLTSWQALRDSHIALAERGA